jgi:MFS transporter, OFA family, oxalate/formate antiporter
VIHTPENHYSASIILIFVTKATLQRAAELVSSDAHLLAEMQPLVPEGGWGWVVVFAAFLVHVCALGFVYSTGIILVALLENFEGATPSQAAYIASTTAAMMLLFSACAAPMTKAIGAMKTCMAGAVVTATGLGLCSASTELWHAALSFVLVGAGLSLAFNPSILSITRWFSARRSLAVGVAVSGSGIGTIVFAPAMLLAITTLGLRLTLGILGGIMGGVFLAASFVYVFPDESWADHFAGLWRCKASAVAPETPKRRTGLMFVIRESPSLRTLVIAIVLGGMGYNSVFAHLINSAIVVGVDKITAAITVSIIGIASTSARVIVGKVVDSGYASPLSIWHGSLFVAGAVSCFLPLLQLQEWGRIVYGVVFGICAGNFIALIPIVSAAAVPLDDLPNALAWMYSSQAIPSLLGPAVMGWILEASGSYLGGWLFAGLSMVVSGLLVLCHPKTPVPLAREPSALIELAPTSSATADPEAVVCEVDSKESSA